jgi:hypothetical protein
MGVTMPWRAAQAQYAPAQEDERQGNQAAQTQANLTWLQNELGRGWEDTVKKGGGSKRKRNPKRKTRRNRK